MAVLAIKTNSQCKICQSPYRSDIDTLLEQRSTRHLTETGQRVNLVYVQAQALALYELRLTDDNVSIHWRKHCERTTEGTVVATQTAAADKLIAILANEVVVDINSDLDKLWAIGLAEIEARISRGERSGITPDVLLRIANEKTRRQHNETQADLLSALGTGIANALRTPKQIEGAEIIDVEVLDES